jgi:pyrimidine operon attenuation protein/uracil phosphoribosyltransferase
MNSVEAPQVLIEHVSNTLKSHLQTMDTPPLLVGIHTAGAWVAEALQEKLAFTHLWTLNPDYQRDDFNQRGLGKKTQPTTLPASIEGKHLLLVDDVMWTGRTIRAAMNELFEYGRPASIILVVLLQRNGRQLPICADIIGDSIDLEPEKRIKLKKRDQQLFWEILNKDD